MSCLVCERIEMIKNGTNPYFVIELETGYVVIGDSHVHWHLFPRVDGDTPLKGPVWWLPYTEMCSESNILSPIELKTMVDSLKNEIIRLICEKEL